MAPPPSSSDPSPQAWRSLRAVLTVQTQNAFNDNVVRFALMGIAFVVLRDNAQALESYKNLIGVLISLPFVIFAPIAGWTSDRFSKREVIQACLYAQIVIIGVIMAAIVIGHLWLATGGFFLLAVQSAFFGPAKLGIMKELVGSRKLAAASGWMQMLTIVAIVFGSPAGGGGYQLARTHITPDPWLAGLVPIGVIALFAVVALLIVRQVQPTPAHHQEPLKVGVFFRHFTDVREVYRSRPVWLSSIGIAFFWFAGAFAIAVFTQVAQENYEGETAAAVASYCLASTGIGIMIGSLFVAFISSNRIELGLVPLGAGAMAISLALATFLPPGAAFYVALALLGAGSAVFLVPQNAYLQDKANPARRGRVLSASNLINSLAAVLANGVQLYMQRAGASSTLQLWLLSICCVLAGAYSLRILPSNFVRVLIKMLLRLLYRLRATGEPQIPETGGALLLANHVTWIDGLLIGAACSRDVRFVAHEQFLQGGGLTAWGLRLFGVIPISSRNARQAIKTTASAVNDGHLVCIFPEGTLTRTGGLNELQKGFELIVRQTDAAPVIPVYLDHLWGSVFSYSENKFFFKLPRKVPYPVTVHFGAPIPAGGATRERVRDALLQLGLEAYRQRPELQGTLRDATIDALKSWKRRLCLVNPTDSGITRLTREAVLTTALQLGQRWKAAIPEGCVALALPPGSPAVLAHLGLVFANKSLANLPLEMAAGEREMLRAALKEAGVRSVITTRALHEKLNHLPWPENVIYLTPELRALRGFDRLKTALRVKLLPRRWLKKRPAAGAAAKTMVADDRAAGEPSVGILSPEGSYHFLQHREILTQVAQVSDTSAFSQRDVLLNLLPYHRASGQILGLWLPLLQGLRLVVPSMSSRAHHPAKMIESTEVSVLMGEATRLDQDAFINAGESLRMIVAAASGREELEAFPQPETGTAGPALSCAWESNRLGWVISLGVPDPVSGSVKQAGRKEGSPGRALPGLLVTSQGTSTDPAPFFVETPCGRPGTPQSTGVNGFIDSEGFLFLQDRDG